MILNKKGINIYSQEEIDYDLGLIVPKEDVDKFVKVRTGNKPPAGYGTQIQKEEFSINNFFRSNNIRMQYKYCFITDKKKFINFVRMNKLNDILVCFDYGCLYNTSDKFGHVVILNSIDKSEAVLIDAYREAAFEKVSIDNLITSVKLHGKENKAGFWLIKPNV